MIDGEPMLELDYKSIHPSLLYAEKGLTVPSDCYDIKRMSTCSREISNGDLDKC